MDTLGIATRDGREQRGLEEIVKFLKKHGGKATEPEIYKGLSVSHSTVQFRINKLCKEGLTKRVKTIDGHTTHENIVVLLGKNKGEDLQ